eukprot:c7958_g1_i1.p1 GENE.c7958_g1_i1~~c7958_g1_i1.p1  ORF type:complete len:458 (+),score=72.69 c7958_g1_i1:285-1658(+)
MGLLLLAGDDKGHHHRLIPFLVNRHTCIKKRWLWWWTFGLIVIWFTIHVSDSNNLHDIANLANHNENELPEGESSRQTVHKTRLFRSVLTGNQVTVLAEQSLVSFSPRSVPVLQPEISCTPTNVTTFDFTYTTQATVDRLWMLQDICRRWRGPMVVAVAINSNITVRKLIKNTAHCLNLTIIPVRVSPDLSQYPVNAMRNIAISHTTTSHSIYLDIDLWPSSCLYDTLHQLCQHHPAVLQDAMHALVIPAFEFTRCAVITANDGNKYIPAQNCTMPLTNADLRRMFLHRQLNIFHPRTSGERSTPLNKFWMLNVRDPLQPVVCFADNKYEPYVVVKNCPFTPQFDERFVGFGKNKIERISHLRRAGWKFSVVPTSFVIHHPHPRTEAELNWLRGTSTHRKEMDSLYDSLTEKWTNAYKRRTQLPDCQNPRRLPLKMPHPPTDSSSPAPAPTPFVSSP